MWEPYLKVIREKCSEALHILDRFHIVAKMNKALDEVRAGESRRMASEGRTPLLKKSRWLLLKREENLKAEQRFRLRDLLRYNLKTVRAYLLKEAFQQLWDYNSPAWAGKFLDEWCRQTMRSRIEPMTKNRAATGRKRYPERRTSGRPGIAPCRSRLGYTLERLHIYVAHPEPGGVLRDCRCPGSASSRSRLGWETR